MTRVDLMVRNGLIVSAEGSLAADLVVDDGKIVAIGNAGGMPQARETIDAQCKYVLPGAIDVHVHFRDPGMTYKEDWGTGTAAAAVGGVTTVFDMPNTHPPTATVDALRAKQERARQLAHIDYGIYGVLDATSLDHIEALVENGVVGFKCFMSESTGELPTPDDGVILEGLEQLGRLGPRCNFHAENGAIISRRREQLKARGRTDAQAHLDSRPAICAIEAVSRAILLSEWTGARLQIAHKSSKDGLVVIRDARRRGVDVTVETCPHYLLLDTRDVDQLRGQLRINPPIREPGHADGLWEGLFDGTIDMITTDHAPHDPAEKLHNNIWDCARGIPGVETQMPLMLTEVNRGRMTIHDYVRWSAVNPAKAWDLYPRKGVLAVGSDADIVVVDMSYRGAVDQFLLHSRHKYTPWHGRPIAGRPIHTISRGRVVVRDGVLVGAPGWGKMVQRNPDHATPRTHRPGRR
jgi:dihydroorotase